MTAQPPTRVRVTEQVLELVEVSYDVELPTGVDVDDAEEHLDRASDEVHRQVLCGQREIVSTEPIAQ